MTYEFFLQNLIFSDVPVNPLLFCKLMQICWPVWTKWINIDFSYYFVGHEIPPSPFTWMGVLVHENTRLRIVTSNQISVCIFSNFQPYLDKADKSKFICISYVMKYPPVQRFIFMKCELCLQILINQLCSEILNFLWYVH